jgi:hypothetical protein
VNAARRTRRGKGRITRGGAHGIERLRGKVDVVHVAAAPPGVGGAVADVADHHHHGARPRLARVSSAVDVPAPAVGDGAGVAAHLHAAPAAGGGGQAETMPPVLLVLVCAASSVCNCDDCEDVSVDVYLCSADVR